MNYNTSQTLNRDKYQDLLAPVEITVSLTVETSQPEVQELRVAAEYQREVQSILVKAFGEDGSASSEFAEQKLVTIQVWRTCLRFFAICVRLSRKRCGGCSCVSVVEYK